MPEIYKPIYKEIYKNPNKQTYPVIADEVEVVEETKAPEVEEVKVEEVPTPEEVKTPEADPADEPEAKSITGKGILGKRRK